ncbi:TPA: protein YchT [Escherichia coli]
MLSKRVLSARLFNLIYG